MFFSYETKTLDVRGLSKKLKNNTVAKELKIASLTVKKEAVNISDRLKELDMLQFSLCSQLASFKENNEEKAKLKVQAFNATLEMLKIAQRAPDSNLLKKVSKLENIEENRTLKEQKITDLKLTIPKIEASLFLNNDELVLIIQFLNDVPIKFDYVITKDTTSTILQPIMIESGYVYPTTRNKIFKMVHCHLKDCGLLEKNTTRIILHFTYESIFFVENRNSDLKGRIVRKYIIDSTFSKITETDNFK